jgi:hypothetical protein
LDHTPRKVAVPSVTTVAANPTNPGCDGVHTPCTYGNTVGNEVGELNLNFRGLLQAETSIATPASVNSDDAPDIYLTNNPGQMIHRWGPSSVRPAR